MEKSIFKKRYCDFVKRNIRLQDTETFKTRIAALIQDHLSEMLKQVPSDQVNVLLYQTWL